MASSRGRIAAYDIIQLVGKRANFSLGKVKHRKDDHMRMQNVAIECGVRAFLCKRTFQSLGVLKEIFIEFICHVLIVPKLLGQIFWCSYAMLAIFR